MLKITPDPPHEMTFDSAPADDLLKDRTAVARALGHYLRDKPAPGVDIEDALVPASSLLRCASVSAVEASSYLDGTQRDRVLSVLYLVDMTRTKVDQALNSLPAR